MTETIEKKVVDAILQQPMEVVIGDRTYNAAPASVATLILVSEAVSRLPQGALDNEKVMEEVLANANLCRPLGEVAAILILGAKGITETIKVHQKQKKRYLWGLLSRTVSVEVEQTIDRKGELTDLLLDSLSPKELNNLCARLLARMQVADFFALTTFLTEINLLRRTKVE